MRLPFTKNIYCCHISLFSDFVVDAVLALSILILCTENSYLWYDEFCFPAFLLCVFQPFCSDEWNVIRGKVFLFWTKKKFLKGLPIFLAETCLFRVFEPLRRKWNSIWVGENCGSDFAPSWRASVVEQVSFIVDFSSHLNTMLLMLSIVSRKYLINRLAQ